MEQFKAFWSNFIPPAFQTPTGFSAVTRRIGTVLTDLFPDLAPRAQSVRVTGDFNF